MQPFVALKRGGKVATPSKNLILERIATQLATITVANGYKTTVATVERVLKTWADFDNTNQLPAIGFGPGRIRYKHHGGGEIECTMPLHVIFHTYSTSDSDRSDDICDLEDDIIDAMFEDATWTEAAFDLHLLESETDESDPDTTNANGGSGTGELLFEIKFNRTIEST